MFRMTSARLLLFSLLLCYTGWGQQEQETTALSVLRSQAQTHAIEFLKASRFTAGSRIGLVVEGSANKEFTLNVFLEIFQQHGCIVAEQDVEAVLEVLVLAQAVSYENQGVDVWKRTARTAMEARLRRRAGGEQEYLGNADYSKSDVVTHKEEGWWVSNEGTMLAQSPPGAFEKILIPVAVIAATVIMVYLFFTVRN